MQIGHLTPRPDATLIAWHNSRDIAAWRDADGVERLVIDGEIINLSPMHHQPTQQVINLCSQDPLSRRRSITRLRAL